MDDQQEREEVKKAYPNSKGWWAKVDKMTSAQVHAIYMRLRSEGKI